MNRNANLGQILGSIPVLIIISFIMIIFVVVSSFLGKTINEDKKFPESSINSLVLLDVFLNTTIPARDLVTFGFSGNGSVPIRFLLNIASRVEPARQEALLKYTQQLFNDFYSCNKQNKLILATFHKADINKRVLIDYPSTFDKFVYPVIPKTLVSATEIVSFCKYHLFSPGASETLGVVGDLHICVYVEARVSC